jgi:hypothetical protein
MSGFWKIFKQTAYFRVSWSIQDIIINYFLNRRKLKESKSLHINAKEIIDKLDNNEFNKHRVKK